ncbi:MAG: GTPase [Thermogutta sp.]
MGSAEEVVLHVVSPDCVEIHCHGSPFVIRQITECLQELGYSLEACDRWIERTEPDKIAAEARQALSAAITFRVVPILMDQYYGALRQQLLQVRRLIQSGKADQAIGLVEALLQWERFGRHLITPWKVALVGPPNVGKSSLFNCLLGYERAIVDTAPGTTRDFVTGTTAFDGWPVELCDTAGLRHTSNPVEQAGTQRTVEVANSADLVLLIFTKLEPWSPSWELWRQRWPRHLIVYNKCDQPGVRDDRPRGVDVSAISGQNLPVLEREIVHHLVPAIPPQKTAVPFTERQVSHLRAAMTHLQQKSLSQVERQLCELLGT